jgi:hypothetical protein
MPSSSSVIYLLPEFAQESTRRAAERNVTDQVGKCNNVHTRNNVKGKRIEITVLYVCLCIST